MKNSSEEIAAAVEYGKENAALGFDYNQSYDAFLAGINWQKNRYRDPDKEYYGG